MQVAEEILCLSQNTKQKTAHLFCLQREKSESKVFSLFNFRLNLELLLN